MMSNEQIWELTKQQQAVHDPLTAAEAIMFNDIMTEKKITLVTENILPDVSNSMQFHPVWPDQLNNYIYDQIVDEPRLKIGILRQRTEVLPILTPT